MGDLTSVLYWDGRADDDRWIVVGTTDGAVTIGEALAHLDPPIPRRTLARLLARLAPVGTVPIQHGGPPAKTYRYSEVARAHAAWARRKSQGS